MILINLKKKHNQTSKMQTTGLPSFTSCGVTEWELHSACTKQCFLFIRNDKQTNIILPEKTDQIVYVSNNVILFLNYFWEVTSQKLHTDSSKRLHLKLKTPLKTIAPF